MTGLKFKVGGWGVRIELFRISDLGFQNEVYLFRISDLGILLFRIGDFGFRNDSE